MSQDVGIDMLKLQTLLPGYVNGSLDSNERQYVRQVLSQSAHARAALAWHEALAEKVINDVEAAPTDIGWSALQARVRAASRSTHQTLGQEASLGVKLKRALASLEFLLPHRWMPAPALGGLCAGLLAVVLVQAWLGVGASNENDFSDVRSGQGAASTVLPGSSKFVRLNFKERVSERDMRLLLIRTGAVIVSGPGQLGDYTVAVPASELDKVLQEFNESLLTESIREVPAPSLLDNTSTTATGAAPVQATTTKTP